jgi:hypothetical protein
MRIASTFAWMAEDASEMESSGAVLAPMVATRARSSRSICEGAAPRSIRAICPSGTVFAAPLSSLRPVTMGSEARSSSEVRSVGSTCTTTSRSSPAGSCQVVATCPASSGRTVVAIWPMSSPSSFARSRFTAMVYSGFGCPSEVPMSTTPGMLRISAASWSERRCSSVTSGPIRLTASGFTAPPTPPASSTAVSTPKIRVTFSRACTISSSIENSRSAGSVSWTNTCPAFTVPIAPEPTVVYV